MNFLQSKSALNIFSYLCEIPLNLEGAASPSFIRVFHEKVSLVTDKVLETISNCFPFQVPLKLFLDFLMKVHLQTDYLTKEKDSHDDAINVTTNSQLSEDHCTSNARKEKLSSTLSNCLVQRIKRWRKEKTNGIEKHTFLSLHQLLEEAEKFCTSSQEPYIRESFEFVHFEVDSFVFDQIFKELSKLFSTEMAILNIFTDCPQIINASYRQTKVQHLNLYKKLVLFTEHDLEKQLICKGWFPNHLFVSCMNIAKTEANDAISRMVDLDKGVPGYEVGFTNHSSSVTDFLQLIYEKFIIGLWQDLNLAKTEESGQSVIHLQTIVVSLIQQYGTLLNERFSTELTELSEIEIIKESTSKVPVEPTWAYINSLAFLLDRIDKMFLDLNYEEYIKPLVGKIGDDEQLPLKSKPGLLVKTFLENLIDEMVKKVIQHEIKPIIANEILFEEDCQILKIMEKFKVQASDAVFRKMASLLLDELLLKFLALSDRLPLAQVEEHDKIFRKFTLSITVFCFEPKEEQIIKWHQLKLKAAKSRDIVNSFLQKCCNNFKVKMSETKEQRNVTSISAQMVINTNEKKLYLEVLNATNLPPISRGMAFGAGACNPYVRLMLLPKSLFGQDLQSSRRVKNKQNVIFNLEEENRALFSFDLSTAVGKVDEVAELFGNEVDKDISGNKWSNEYPFVDPELADSAHLGEAPNPFSSSDAELISISCVADNSSITPLITCEADKSNIAPEIFDDLDRKVESPENEAPMHHGAIVVQVCHASVLSSFKMMGNNDAVIGQVFIPLR